MWLDYALFLSTGLVLLAVVAVIVSLTRESAGRGSRIVLVALLLIGLVATALLRPEQFRERGEDLVVTATPDGPTTEVDQIGTCLSLFRRIGPLSYIAGTAFLPDESWDRGPYSGCDAAAFSGVLRPPETVRSGEWMPCDYATCHELLVD